MTQEVMRVMMEGMSQRSAARNLGIATRTVARKINRLGRNAKTTLDNRTPEDLIERNLQVVQFDEMETFVHTKMKPVSIALAVSEESREIISISAQSMPATGTLASKSVAKYGPRKDDRVKGLAAIFNDIRRLCPHLKVLKSDQSPRYPLQVRTTFSGGIKHETFIGRRGCVTGQGELKRGVNDPLFSLNHTAAMLRDRIKRLSRRTWCTTKKISTLLHQLHIYAWWHNQLLRKLPRPYVLT